MNELRKELEIDTKLELLKEHKCCAESILCIETYMYRIEQENQQLKDQLQKIANSCKQRDEVIDETIKFCNYLLENNEVEIDNEKYFKHSCDDIVTNAILKKLQKYKGDNNG